jgi:fatty acid desaturase
MFHFIVHSPIFTKSDPSWGDHTPLLSDSDPRELMKQNLPDWLQPFLTQLTAKPFIGEQPHEKSKLGDVIKTFAVLGIGVTTSILAISQPDSLLGLIPIGWILTIHGSRKLRLTIVHACSHHGVFTNRKINQWLGEFSSILTLTLNFKAYQKGHNGDHHSRKLLTPGDETYEYLITTVGFRLGMTVEEAWRHLWRTLFSPEFHIRQFIARLKATFLSESPSHNLLSLVFWASILGVVTITNSWLAFVVAWVIPISVLFEASSLLRQCVEHRFPVPTTAERTPEVLNQMTAAIFCGEPIPQFGSSASWIERLVGWTRWSLRMVFYHGLTRLLVLPGDSAGAHDWHHRHPGVSDWVNAIFKRQQEVDQGIEYYHSWGLMEAINETFKSLSQMPENGIE